MSRELVFRLMDWKYNSEFRPGKIMNACSEWFAWRSEAFAVYEHIELDYFTRIPQDPVKTWAEVERVHCLTLVDSVTITEILYCPQNWTVG